MILAPLDYLSDDLLLDKETGFVWARDVKLADERKNRQDAINYCRNVTLGNRKGWRIPTIEELSSLVDPSRRQPALPSGHPFVNVPSYNTWSSTTFESRSGGAWIVHTGTASLYAAIRASSATCGRCAAAMGTPQETGNLSHAKYIWGLAG